jgi:hypothetical protein
VTIRSRCWKYSVILLAGVSVILIGGTRAHAQTSNLVAKRLAMPPCTGDDPSAAFPTCNGKCPDHSVCVPGAGNTCGCATLKNLESLSTSVLTCHWRGEAPACDGECEMGETERARCTDDCPHQPCDTGSKALCCRPPDAN